MTIGRFGQACQEKICFEISAKLLNYSIMYIISLSNEFSRSHKTEKLKFTVYFTVFKDFCGTIALLIEHRAGRL